ncbi:hypothetical protein [Afipia sp. 1NLS2]|uniref:hypothetical protein n=1 Tax=Afipia sp. 1NLS2 TaxID=666684 RepID=UPI0001D9FD6F|nr:hypothetical protein [Afipia sp. 1NLS2]EFI53127.1 dead/deah box helicase domain-containing protein [Afipia sp. 1NLS2]
MIDLVAHAYGGYLATLRGSSWRDGMIARLADLLDRMTADGLIEERDGALRLTMPGRA